MTVRPMSVVLLAGLLMLYVSGAAAQPVDSESHRETEPIPTLEGRHGVSFGVGLLPDAQVNPGTVSANGFLASLSYAYWPHAEWGVEVSASLHESELTGGNAASVTSLLFGASYYPEALALGSFARPYVGVAAGPYVGSETHAGIGGAGTRTQTVVGARLGAGIDAFAWSWLRLGLRAAYHAAPEYENAPGSIQSPSGAQVSFEFGVTFGGR